MQSVCNGIPVTFRGGKLMAQSRSRLARAALLAVTLAAAAACARDRGSADSGAASTADSPLPTAQDSARDAAARAADSVEVVGPPENTPSPAAPRRYTVRVRVPYGLTRDQLTAMLTRVAEGRRRALDANALLVLAYRQGEPGSGPYTAGRAVIAPYGEWGWAGEPGPLQVKVDVADAYFAGDPTAATGSERVLVTDGRTQTIRLSRRFESGGDADVVAQLPAGTKVTILETRTSGRAITGYRVRAQQGGRKVEGWVRRENVR